jgi:plastocyanin domain-containing protein
MVIMGLNMLGLFQGSVGSALRRFTPRMPKIFTKKIHESVNKGPFFVGLLNGLMPCGPLQAMQLYALSTGSPVAGGVSMFLFSAGTAPLMFGIGALSGVLSRKFTRMVLRFGAVLVTVMGMGMFSYGFGLSGINFDPAGRIMAALRPSAPLTGEAFTPVIENGYQIVNSNLSGGRYPAITVRQGIPVRWTINAPQGSINGCNNRMIIREYGIEYRFRTGENIIEFTPDKSGRFPYSCWMGMIRSSITVLAEGESAAVVQEPDTAPVPAGVNIPVDGVAVAELRENGRYQAVTIQLRDGGFEPSIVVMRNGLPALWTINNDSLDPGNSRVVFPAYYTQLDIGQGNTMIRLLPGGDFAFSTGDYVFYGYVKTVDDLDAVDIEEVKAEVSVFETLIYPDAYFEAAAGGSGGCCAR